MTELVCYQIETRHPVTGHWKTQRECRCNYEREDYTSRFFGFLWKISKSRIINKRTAEICCRKEVMMCRRSYEKEFKDVRVLSVKWDGGYYKFVVWENGVWKDC